MKFEHAADICSWRYPEPYNIYGWLPWEQMVQLGVEFGDTHIREQQYISIVDERDRLWGFAQLFPMENVIRLGLGMRPDWCGHGMGKRFMTAIMEEALRRYPDQTIDLEVLSWNERAIRTYRKVGFCISDCYEKLTPSGPEMFYCMVYTPTLT
ncbi:GNAT family N-acetyltransferase [Paenibacillus lemnae]|uniref:GNAT family N-acetyltransferase n=2 Tax=Paenibacillus lemnae TaxID=1330551 RepID=A0A848MB46_PAELE|nr:GNAT family N-acetyltransferase [Paenibacillus lemnae]